MDWGRLAPLLSILLQLLGLGLGLGSNMLMARLLGPGGYGEYAFVYNLVTILAVPMEVGLVMVVVRDASALLAQNDAPGLASMSRAAARVSLAFTLPCSAMLLMLGASGFAWLGSYAPVFVGAALLMPISSFLVMRTSLLRASGLPLWSQALANVVRPTIFLAFLLGLFGGGRGRIPPDEAMLWHAVAAGIALMFALLIKRSPWQDKRKTATPPGGWLIWARDIPAFSMMAAVMALNQGLGGMSAAYFLGPKEVGLYRMAEMAASLVAMPLSTLAVYYSSPVARLLAGKDMPALGHTLRTAARLALLCALPVALCLGVWGRWLLNALFQSDFGDAYLPMMVLCVAQVLNAMMGLGGLVMSMSGRHNEVLVVVLLAVLVQFVSGWWLTPHIGLVGVALASAAGTLCWTVVLQRRVKHHLGLEIATWASGRVS